MNMKTQQDAEACLAAISVLANNYSSFVPTILTTIELAPIRVLLDRTEALLDGKVEARGRKNAGDRKRRARKKTPGRKPRDKNPLLDGLELPGDEPDNS